jgi:uncharacterized protein YndB with AHSA1/START domain
VTPPIVTVERTIAAKPQQIFDVLADPSQHPLIDGSGSVRSAAAGNPRRLSRGARFGMGMRLGAPYRIRNTVVEFDEPRRIAWRHFARHRWRYLLTPVDAGTLVREEWDSTPVPWLYPALRLLGFPERNRRGMEQTLARLDARVGTGGG